MKRRLTITPDNRPAGVRVILANRKGHILYDLARDRTAKRKRLPAERESARSKREVIK